MTNNDVTKIMPNEPVVDDKRIKRIYVELQGMHEKLDPDPIALGPKRINNKIAKVRNMLKRCVDIELQVQEDLHFYTRACTREKGKYELEYQGLVANDPHVRAGRSAADREANAKTRLVTRRVEIMRLEEKIHDLEQLLTVIRVKAKDVRDIQARLKDQIKIIDHELGLGARWGNSSPSSYPPSSFGGREQAVAADSDLVSSMLDEVDARTPELPQADYESPDEMLGQMLDAEADAKTLPGSATSEDADDALAAIASVPEMAEETEVVFDEPDVDAILASLE